MRNRRFAWTAAVSAGLLLAVSACSPGPEQPSGTNLGLQDWAESTLGDQLEAASQSGFAASGRTDSAGADDDGYTGFEGVEPGWYAVTMACTGPAGITVKIEGSVGSISRGGTDCDTPPVTATVQIPVDEFRLSVEEAEVEVLWAVAAEPTEKPAP